MPFDQHFLVALMAPRLVYTSTKTNDSWADPASEFESLVQASPVYGLFGLKGLDRQEPPLPETRFMKAVWGITIKPGTMIWTSMIGTSI